MQLSLGFGDTSLSFCRKHIWGKKYRTLHKNIMLFWTLLNMFLRTDDQENRVGDWLLGCPTKHVGPFEGQVSLTWFRKSVTSVSSS